MQRALVVAGSESIWSLVRGLLNGLEMRCHRVSGESEALAIASSHRCALVIVDPASGIDSVALIDSLRRFGLNSGLPAVILSETPLTGLPAGVATASPFDLVALSDAASDAIALRPSSA